MSSLFSLLLQPLIHTYSSSRCAATYYYPMLSHMVTISSANAFLLSILMLPPRCSDTCYPYPATLYLPTSSAIFSPYSVPCFHALIQPHVSLPFSPILPASLVQPHATTSSYSSTWSYRHSATSPFLVQPHSLPALLIHCISPLQSRRILLLFFQQIAIPPY